MRRPVIACLSIGLVVDYDSTPPLPGPSLRGIECLLRLSGDAPIQCT